MGAPPFDRVVEREIPVDDTMRKRPAFKFESRLLGRVHRNILEFQEEAFV